MKKDSSKRPLFPVHANVQPRFLQLHAGCSCCWQVIIILFIDNNNNHHNCQAPGCGSCSGRSSRSSSGSSSSGRSGSSGSGSGSGSGSVHHNLQARSSSPPPVQLLLVDPPCNGLACCPSSFPSMSPHLSGSHLRACNGQCRKYGLKLPNVTQSRQLAQTAKYIVETKRPN